METREKSRKTNTDALEIEGRQQGGAGAAHALAHNANRANPDQSGTNLGRDSKLSKKRTTVNLMKSRSN